MNMEIKVASKTEIHEIIKKFPGTKSVIWENDDNTYLLLAKENNHIIGFSFSFRRKIPAPIGDLSEDFINVIEVLELNKRNKGIGSALVQQSIAIAKDNGSIQVRAYCDISNEASHRLWLKNGFGISPVKLPDGNIVGSFVTYRIK
jgi:RimJ/RimL family protein N-acetyltransferase